jgi:hypothetical protein
MSVNTLGSTADKILPGEVDPDTLDEEIERCAWCQKALVTRQCWHQGRARPSRQRPTPGATSAGGARPTTLASNGHVVGIGRRGVVTYSRLCHRDMQDFREEPSDGLEPSTPSLPWKCSTD